MRQAKQTDFFESSREHAPRRYAHGGELGRGLRKLRRPLDRRRPVHLVLRSSHARGKLSMRAYNNRLSIERILKQWARRFSVTLHSWQNVGNHLHIVTSFSERKRLQDFLRTVTALIARHVTGARKGRPFGKRFWDELAFSRVIMGRRDFLGMKNYIEKNRIEAEVNQIARQVVEEYEAAARTARRKGCDIWEILESSSP